MQATITYLLTEQAQRALMAATGQPVSRRQVHVIDVTTDQLPYLWVRWDGSLDKDLAIGVEVCNAPDLSYETLDGAAEFARYVDAIARDIERARQKVETERAAKDARNAKLQASDGDIAAWIDSLPDGSDEWNIITKAQQSLHLPGDAQLPLAVQAFDRLVLRNKSLVARNEAAKAAKTAEAEAAKAAAIDAFVGQSGDAMLIEQHAARLLCRKTVISLMAGDCLDRYLPAECPDSVVCENSRCPCMDTRQDCVPPDIYAAWKAMGEMPTGTTVEFREVRNCLSDEDTKGAGPVEYHAVVTIPSGPFQFERRIKLESK